jgi:hypothetical protein
MLHAMQPLTAASYRFTRCPCKPASKIRLNKKLESKLWKNTFLLITH